MDTKLQKSAPIVREELIQVLNSYLLFVRLAVFKVCNGLSCSLTKRSNRHVSTGARHLIFLWIT